MKHVFERMGALILGGGMMATAAAQITQAPVTLHFNERPPYLMERDGVLTGLTGAPAVAAFTRAGIAFTLRETPAARQLELVRQSAGVDCAVGWFKNEERAGFARITRAVYQDRPQIALVAAYKPVPKTGDAIETVMGNKDLTLLVKQGYSYGRSLDGLMARLRPTIRAAVVENVQMVRMVLAGRSDYMLTAPEEADGLIAALGSQGKVIRKVEFTHMPPGESRHILCSKNMPDSLFNKLNLAIQ